MAMFVFVAVVKAVTSAAPGQQIPFASANQIENCSDDMYGSRFKTQISTSHIPVHF
jgi:hypothetical protein